MTLLTNWWPLSAAEKERRNCRPSMPLFIAWEKFTSVLEKAPSAFQVYHAPP
jgi:hypothetical protein